MPFVSHSKGYGATPSKVDRTPCASSLPSAADVLGAALLRAVCTGSAELVNAFIRAGANIGFVDALGFSAMHYVAQYGTPQVAWLFVQRGVDVNVPDRHGRTPLFHAVRTARSVLVHYLIAWSAKIQIDDLRMAVETGNTEDAVILVEEWIHTGKTLDTLDELLLQAVKQRDKNMVELLLENGARALATDTAGRTALTIAASAEDRELALLLIEYGADPDGWNVEGNRSLAEVVKWRHLAMVELLLSKGTSSCRSLGS
ncbi:ankyrin repeat [Lecanosticta acicola]|uniref:Ankyrin repeat n=1 Tax=Lecanosticta acicola TaxID=111012 RepID=A0AAI9ED31_9PEZI|nr:ankyrin repeat [Lecanosticta acicola]